MQYFSPEGEMLPISLELPCFFLSLSPPSSRPPLSLSSSPRLSSSFFPFCLPPFLLSPFLPSSFYFSFLPLFLPPSFLSHSPSLSLSFSPSIPVSLSLSPSVSAESPKCILLQAGSGWHKQSPVPGRPELRVQCDNSQQCLIIWCTSEPPGALLKKFLNPTPGIFKGAA